jgi:GT2 family glycosyltransferase
MAQPTVSVIIPTCGRPELLLECVASILDNDFSDFEILVVDQDPSQSLKAKLSRKFNDDPRISYLFLDEAALDKARNMGIEHACGEILVFADDDVEVVSGWLRAYIDAFTRIQPSPGIVGGRLDPLWLSPKPEWLPEEKEYLLGIYNRGDELMPMPEGELPMGANFAVLHRTVDAIGKFDERVDYSYARKTSMISGGDSFFSLKAKQANYPIYYQPQAQAWHKISKHKLTKKYFLRRNFWEGVTIVIVLYLSGSATPASFPGIIRWHMGAIRSRLWRFFFAKNESGIDWTQSKAWMRLAAECSYSLGVIYCGLKFLWTHKLP